MKVMIIESNYPKDFYEDRLDGKAAFAVLKLAGVEVEYRAALDEEHLLKSIDFANKFQADILHLSCHGDATGIALTNDTRIDWAEISDKLQSLASPKRLLVYASCEGGHFAAAKAFEKQTRRFGFICGSRDNVGYYESCIAWPILYNLINKNRLNRETMVHAISKINDVVDGTFVYRRWEASIGRYLVWPTLTTGG